jgi:hypothetical protein
MCTGGWPAKVKKCNLYVIVYDIIKIIAPTEETLALSIEIHQ